MPKTALRIRIYGDNVLRRKAVLVKSVTAECQETLSRMAITMYEGGGIGLAAPQVGISQQLIVVDIGTGLYKLVNPRIIKRQGTQVTQEGCLSVPGICINVKRAKKIWLKALDADGKFVDIQAEDLLACAFQHEIDHLKGKMIVDYAKLFDKMKIKKKLEALERRSRDTSNNEPALKQCRLKI
ncbi:MAG: peptide deformylase [Candidatus Omnitrophota bacterium]|jgi:peptide deformylase